MQAAELTRITMDPSDGQHLPIRKLKFTDPDTLHFEVQSTQDEEEQDDDDEGSSVSLVFPPQVPGLLFLRLRGENRSCTASP